MVAGPRARCRLFRATFWELYPTSHGRFENNADLNALSPRQAFQAFHSLIDLFFPNSTHNQDITLDFNLNSLSSLTQVKSSESLMSPDWTTTLNLSLALGTYLDGAFIELMPP